MNADLFAPAVVDALPINLYDWQGMAVAGLKDGILSGRRIQILVAPTGAGKTVIASHKLKRCYDKGRKALFICDRINLIEQTSATLTGFGIPHGVIQGNHERTRRWEKIQIASAQTLIRRTIDYSEYDLIVVDECHTVHSIVKKIISQARANPKQVVIGLTATPFTKGLGKLYDGTVNVRTTNQLIADKLLAPWEAYAPSAPNMEGVRVIAGEWDETEGVERCMQVVGDIVQEYLKHGRDRKFICFGWDVKHCQEIQRQFAAARITTALYTYKEDDEGKKETLKEFARPNSYIQGLISVSALAKGFDNPSVGVVIMARPLKSSLAEHVQIWGRGLRRDPDNPEKVCTILDHAGNVERFWKETMDFFESGPGPLCMGKKAEKKEKAERKQPEPVKCPQCKRVHNPMPFCPHCGFQYPKRSMVEYVPGTLSLITGKEQGTREDKQEIFSQLLDLAHDRGYKPGFAYYKFEERFGEKPIGLSIERRPYTRKLADWVTSRFIAKAAEERKQRKLAAKQMAAL